MRKTYVFYTEKCEKMGSRVRKNAKNLPPVYVVGIQTHDLLNTGSPPITTRPGFPLIPSSYCTRIFVYDRVENALLLCKGKYHCTADLLFFVKVQLFNYFEFESYLLVWLNPNKLNSRSTVH